MKVGAMRGCWVGAGLLLLSGCYSGFDADADSAGSGDATASGSATAGGADGGNGGDGADSGGDDPGDDGAIGSGETPMRRLTGAQFVTSVRDLLELPDWAPSGDLPNDGFNEEEFQLSNMLASGVSTTLVDYNRYREVAKEAASAALDSDDDVLGRLGCQPSTATDACAQTWLLELCARAWSRPVTADDPVFAALLSAAEDGEARLGTARDGLRWAVTALLQSPEFLYVYPVGRADDPTQMDDFSVARQLALTFRDSIPDAELLDLAADGALSDPNVRAAQIDRLIAQMVADPEHRGAAHRFFDEWWSMNVVESTGKDPDAYPEFTDELRVAMKREVELWIADLVFEQRGDFRSIVNSNKAFVNAQLAALYGLEGEFGPEFVAVDLPQDSPRIGLLTTGAFLSVMAHPSLTSPAARGKFISERLLCVEIPPPPGDVDTTIPPPTKPETKRERFSRHNTDPVCAGCHTLMDPSGMALETFDAIGRHRLTETVYFEGQDHELTIDPAGSLLGQDFADSKAMGAILADSPNFSTCITRQMMRHTFGREIEGAEEDVIDTVAAEFADANYDFLSLMRAVALHPNFTTINAAE
ncbi:MAG: DUF1592 domain-containing protein [Myxococcota bacterium]